VNVSTEATSTDGTVLFMKSQEEGKS